MLKKYLTMGIAALGVAAFTLGAAATPTQAAYVTPGVSITIGSGMSNHPNYHPHHHRHHVQVCKTYWHHHHKVLVCEWVWKYW